LLRFLEKGDVIEFFSLIEGERLKSTEEPMSEAGDAAVMNTCIFLLFDKIA